MRHREYRVFHRPAGIQSPTGRQRPARRCMDAAPRGSESSSAFYAFPMESLHTPNPKQYRLATPNPSFNPNPNPNQWTFFPRTLASIAAPRTTTRFVVPYIAASSCPTSSLASSLHGSLRRPFTVPCNVASSTRRCVIVLSFTKKAGRGRGRGRGGGRGGRGRGGGGRSRRRRRGAGEERARGAGEAGEEGQRAQCRRSERIWCTPLRAGRRRTHRTQAAKGALDSWTRRR